MKNLTKNKKIIFILSITAIIMGGVLIFSSVFGVNLLSLSSIKRVLSSGDNEVVSGFGEVVLVETRKIYLQLATSDISISGVTEPLDEVKVSSKMGGKIVALYFDEGDKVKSGQILVSFDNDDITAQLLQAESGLDAAKAVLAELEQGARTEEVQVHKTQVLNVEISVQDAQVNLENTKNQVQASLDSAYASALTSLQGAANFGKNAILTISDIQKAHFNSNDQEGLRVQNAKAIVVQSFLGGQYAGRWETKFISELGGGMFGIVNNVHSAQAFDDIDSTLLEMSVALNEIRQTLNAIPISNSLSSAEKTNLIAQKTIIDGQIAAISGSQQGISVQKITNNSLVSAAEINLNSVLGALKNAQDQLVLIESGASSEQVAAQKARVKLAQANVCQVQARLSETIIKSPITGIVNDKYIEVGEFAAPGQPLVTVINTDSIAIELGLTEFDIGYVWLGQEVRINLAAYPDEEFIGHIYYISQVADLMTKKFPIKIQLKNTNKHIKAGMVAQARIITKQEENIMAVPKESVFMEGDQEKIYLVNDGLVEIKTIKTELFNGSELKVIEGLFEEDEIIVNGNYELKEGNKVEIKK